MNTKDFGGQTSGLGPQSPLLVPGVLSEIRRRRWVIIPPMPEEPFRGIVGMVPDEFKHEPRSKGLLTARKKKPKTGGDH